MLKIWLSVNTDDYDVECVGNQNLVSLKIVASNAFNIYLSRGDTLGGENLLSLSFKKALTAFLHF